MAKTIKIMLISVLSGLLGTADVYSQIEFQSLEDVWEYALVNNTENTIYRLKKEQAKQDKKNADSYLFPKITAGFNGQKNFSISETPVPGELLGQPGETVYLKFGQEHSYNSGITVNAPLFDWQSVYQSKIAKLNTSLVTVEKEYFEQTLREQVAQLYYAILTANKSLLISIKDMEIADSLLSIANDRFSQGVIDGITLNQAKINRNNVYEKYQQSKQYKNQCFNRLKMLLGMNPADSVSFTENIEAGIFQQTNFLIPVNSFYQQRYQLQSEMAIYEEKKALSGFAPKIALNYYYGAVQYQDDLTISFNSSEWKPNSYLGLTVTLPLFTGLSNKSRYSSAKISKNIAKRTYEDEIRKSAINDSILANDYLASLNMVQSSVETYRVSANSMDLAGQKYTQGLISLDDYLKIFEDYLTIENHYLNNLSNFLINKAIIEARKNNQNEN